MNVLLAGCGWLGREVARRLTARGDRVEGVTRTEASALRLRESGIEARALDLARPGASRSLHGRYDGIVAMQSAAGRDAPAYKRAYIDATHTLLESEIASGSAFVYVSSTGVFGQSDGSWVNEATTPQPTGATADLLVAAEQTVLDRSSHDAMARVVRCSGLYGPGRTGTIERVRNGSLTLGDGDDTWMNFVHRIDAANLIIAALDRGRPGAVYHASDATPTTRRDVVLWIAGRLGFDPLRRAADDAPRKTRGANRRVSADASRLELGVGLLYPSFREGLLSHLA